MTDDFLHRYQRELPKAYGDALFRHIQEQENEPMNIALNGHAHTTIAKMDKRSPVIGRRWIGGLAAIAAAMLITVGVLSMLMPRPQPSATLVQIETQLLPEDLQVITPANADRIELLATLGNGSLTSAAWSPSGMTIATGGARGIWLFEAADLAAGSRLLTTEGGYMVNTIAYSPDGARLAAGDVAGFVHIFDAETGVLETAFNAGTYVYSIAFADDGARLYIAAEDEFVSQAGSTITRGFIRVWDFAAQSHRDIDTAENTPYQLDVQGSTLAYLSPQRVMVIDLETELARQITTAEEGISGLALSPDGQTLVASIDSGISSWDVATGEQIATYGPRGYSGRGGFALHILAFNNQGDAFAVKSGQYVHIYDVDDPMEIQTLRYQNEPTLSIENDLKFSPDDEAIALLTRASLQVIDTTSGELTQHVEDFDEGIRDLVLRPDTQQVITWQFDTLNDWSLETGEVIPTFAPTGVSDHDEQVDFAFSNTFDISPDGSTLLFSRQETLRMVDSRTGERLWQDLHRGAQLSQDWQQQRGIVPQFANDGQWVANLSAASTQILLWDAATGEDQAPIELPYTVTAIDFAGRYAALAHETDGGYAVSIWDVVAAEELTQLPIFEDIDTLTFSPDAQRLAVLSQLSDAEGVPSGQLSISVWDWETQTQIADWTQQSSVFLPELQFSPDNRLLMINGYGYQRGQTQLLEVTSGNIVYQFPTGILNSSAVINSDQRLIVTGGYDGLVRAWGVRAR
jgi:WD40 repeat protein